VLSADFPSFLNKVNLFICTDATSCDPFWISRFNELKELQTMEPSPYFVPTLDKTTYISSKNFSLDDRMSKEIVKWWSDSSHPWNTEVPNAQILKKESAEQVKRFSEQKEILDKEINELNNQLAERKKILLEPDYLHKLAQLKVDIAKKHSEISSYLLAKSTLDEIKLSEDEDFMRTLNEKNAELDKLLDEHKKTPSLSQFKTLTLNLLQKQTEAEMLLIEIDHLQKQLENKITPLYLSLSQDRVQQRRVTKLTLSKHQMEVLKIGETQKLLN
jgi:hypothetical protein